MKKAVLVLVAAALVLLSYSASAFDVDVFSDFLFRHGFTNEQATEIFETLPVDEQIIVLTVLAAREDGQDEEVIGKLRSQYQDVVDQNPDAANLMGVLFSDESCRDGRGSVEEEPADEDDMLSKALTPEQRRYDLFQHSLRSRLHRSAAAPQGDFFTPPAHDSADGVIFTWNQSFDWMLVDLIEFVTKKYKVWVSTEHVAYVNYYLSNFDVNLDNVEFIPYQTDSIWVRDFGPRWIYEENGDRAIIDIEYFSQRPRDNAFPAAMASHMGMNHYESGIKTEGGNLIFDGHGAAIMTNAILEYHTKEWVEYHMRRFFNVHKVIFVHPMHREGTGHIDMFCKLIDEDRIVIGEYLTPAEGGDNYYILRENARILENATNGRGEPFEVIRMPMPPHLGTPYFTTYTNSLIVNDKVLVPIYGIARDAEVLAQYQQLLPNHSVKGFDSRALITYHGAIHCISKLVMSEPSR